MFFISLIFIATNLFSTVLIMFFLERLRVREWTPLKFFIFRLLFASEITGESNNSQSCDADITHVNSSSGITRIFSFMEISTQRACNILGGGTGYHIWNIETDFLGRKDYAVDFTSLDISQGPWCEYVKLEAFYRMIIHSNNFTKQMYTKIEWAQQLITRNV